MVINDKRFAIENRILILFATQSPMARDLRLLAAVLELITELERIRKGGMADYVGTEIKLTMMSFVMKACAQALKLHPTLNASIDTETEEIRYKQYVNIGVAVDTERGLVVPNMRQMISEPRMMMQFRLHLAALLLLLGAVPLPLLVYPGGAALIASCIWLEWNLVVATRNFARFSRELEERLAAEKTA